ncbi:MAG: mevalonate kinase [Candidatus Aenigmarchaeota archaeon]|nr:mevalonate kinase [Candidatus Aenigmarchaeota archaeon]
MNVSAPGKIIIIGEHAVVYGKPAIIAAVNKRCNVAIKKAKTITVSSPLIKAVLNFSAPEAIERSEKADALWKKCAEAKDFSALFAATKNNGDALKAGIGKILREFRIDGGADIKIDSDIPIGYGMGSSAALAVSLTKAITSLYGKNVALEELNAVAYKLEQYSHGTPSGGDNTASCFGGVMRYVKEPKTMERLDLGKLENFILIYCAPPMKTTGELVQSVRNLDAAFRAERVDALGLLAERMLGALRKRDHAEIKHIINEAQKNLQELGVSTPEIDKVCKRVEKTGGAAKLCGAGGGGVVMCYHEDAAKLEAAVRAGGYEPQHVQLGAEGVMIDS